ncbi:homocysteine S-methyltransferase [Caenispirillum salinarum AK4]|uniref:Homocysteine S-methyltransferase n=1 Tax=Caenispirillum salinarum AK4 TaxID=1238182 RepID=K9HHF6_9PROT|nr:homocysteine S-methyltransferase family protein [Caenispirillum salinarum]EKV28051.1 homocysteine S-methyltransferase [Caenispirillum salinarum AK4]
MTAQTRITTLPQLAGRPFVSDGGMETWLIFHESIELRDFAAFELLATRDGRATLERWYRRHAEIAAAHGAGFIYETPTWRANRDWGARLGYDRAALRAINRDSVAFVSGIRDALAAETGQQGVVSGCIGPRGDGYIPGDRMASAEAAAYHSPQVEAFADAGADMVSAMTLSYAAEAAGIAHAATAAGISCALSFTVETDGRLPSGETLREAIEAVDAETGGAAAYYMINCAHPTHFAETLSEEGAWKTRIRGIRANASRMSHAELEASETLDDGDPEDLGARYKDLHALLPALAVVGGCCGTDHRHVEAVARACL